jgi:hypothetical protein
MRGRIGSVFLAGSLGRQFDNKDTHSVEHPIGMGRFLDFRIRSRLCGLVLIFGIPLLSLGYSCSYKQVKRIVNELVIIIVDQDLFEERQNDLVDEFDSMFW